MIEHAAPTTTVLRPLLSLLTQPVITPDHRGYPMTEDRKMTEFADCPECGMGVNIVTKPTECYRCKTAVWGVGGEQDREDAPPKSDSEPGNGTACPTAPGSTHYRQLPVEPIEVTKHMGFLDGNVVKYVMRFREKNGLEDLHKAQQYLQWLIQKEYPHE